MGKAPTVPGLARANLLPWALAFASPPCSDQSGTVQTLPHYLASFLFLFLHNNRSASLPQGRPSITAFLGRGCWGSCQFLCCRKASFGAAFRPSAFHPSAFHPPAFVCCPPNKPALAVPSSPSGFHWAHALGYLQRSFHSSNRHLAEPPIP